MAAHYEWELIDKPHVRVTADVLWGSNAFSARGTHRAQHFAATWKLELADDWVTRSLEIVTTGDGWSRRLALTRDNTGQWHDDVGLTGEQPAALSLPGISDDVDLNQARDCDLGLCPLTSTMPIRRLSLHTRPHAVERLIMAWVEVPSLRVIASDQYYGSQHGDGLVNYASGTRDVDVQLRVDEQGIVREYPGLAKLASDG